MLRHAAVMLLVCASLAFGQLDSNSVSVTASRNSNLSPDQAVYGVYVDSDLHASVTDVVAALQGSGITIANFSSVNSVQKFDPLTGKPLPLMLEWGFRLPVALSKIKDTVAMLTALQQRVGQNSGVSLSFNLQGTQVSDQLQQSQTCATADLISDARSSAQRLASAAGLSVGTILAISGQSSAFPSCTITVKFALGRF